MRQNLIREASEEEKERLTGKREANKRMRAEMKTGQRGKEMAARVSKTSRDGGEAEGGGTPLA